MPITLPDDYWIEIPGGTYRVGLEPDEVRELAEVSAAVARRRLDEIRSEFPTEDDIDHLHAFDQQAVITREEFEWSGDASNVLAMLEERYGAYEVDIPAYAIARAPVSNELFRQFLAETSGRVPEWPVWHSQEPASPVSGVPWTLAVQFAAWAGGR